MNHYLRSRIFFYSLVACSPILAIPWLPRVKQCASWTPFVVKTAVIIAFMRPSYIPSLYYTARLPPILTQKKLFCEAIKTWIDGHYSKNKEGQLTYMYETTKFPGDNYSGINHGRTIQSNCLQSSKPNNHSSLNGLINGMCKREYRNKMAKPLLESSATRLQHCIAADTCGNKLSQNSKTNIRELNALQINKAWFSLLWHQETVAERLEQFVAAQKKYNESVEHLKGAQDYYMKLGLASLGLVCTYHLAVSTSLTTKITLTAPWLAYSAFTRYQPI